MCATATQKGPTSFLKADVQHTDKKIGGKNIKKEREEEASVACVTLVPSHIQVDNHPIH